MKGDWILLGFTGLALLVVPLTVLTATGATLPEMPPVGLASSASASVHAPGGVDTEQWQTTVIPGGQEAETASPPESAQSASSRQASAEVEPAPVEEYAAAVKSFRILDRTTGKVNEVAVRDYVRGAVAAEMPASFHQEALKAQGVAALTYALYHHDQQQKNPDPALLGADFSADPQKREGYMTEKQAKKFYGDNWQYNWDKVVNAADEAVNYVALYQNQPIAAAYHAISTGTTEDAANIWGQPMPCLLPVDSGGDILAKDYRTTVTLSQSQIKEALKDSGVELLPNADTWFQIETRSDSGYVTQVRVGNQTMTGNQLRNLLELRSSSFQIERQGKDFLFYVCGYGHGAGLSQNGADHMARQGSGFIEILEHYYPGANVTKVRFP